MPRDFADAGRNSWERLFLWSYGVVYQRKTRYFCSFTPKGGKGTDAEHSSNRSRKLFLTSSQCRSLIKSPEIAKIIATLWTVYRRCGETECPPPPPLVGVNPPPERSVPLVCRIFPTNSVFAQTFYKMFFSVIVGFLLNFVGHTAPQMVEGVNKCNNLDAFRMTHNFLLPLGSGRTRRRSPELLWPLSLVTLILCLRTK